MIPVTLLRDEIGRGGWVSWGSTASRPAVLGEPQKRGQPGRVHAVGRPRALEELVIADQVNDKARPAQGPYRL